jgi:predicted Rossmann-fold nucleotide-binding protein
MTRTKKRSYKHNSSSQIGKEKLAKVVDIAKEAFLRHRNFETAKEALEYSKKAIHSAQTESSSYTLAFAGNQFLLRDDMRHARLQLEYQKCDLILNEHGVEHTLVVFGSARIKERKIAEKELSIANENFEKGLITEQELQIKKRMVVKSRYYDEALEFGRIAARNRDKLSPNLAICSGGGPSLMEASLRGAHELGCPTVGLNIVLPFEQHPNPYITPELCFNFHYFSVRKMHFLLRARALVAFPGIVFLTRWIWNSGRTV